MSCPWQHKLCPRDTSEFVFQTDRPTVIEYDDHEYLFEGFSLFSHTPLTSVSVFANVRLRVRCHVS